MKSLLVFDIEFQHSKVKEEEAFVGKGLYYLVQALQT